MSNPQTLQQIEKEIIRLHVFFEDWFNGTIDLSDETFRQFADSMAPSFSIVAPSGAHLSRHQILESVYGAYNKRPGTRISIANPRVVYHADGHLLAMYEEWQNDQGIEKGRLSSVLFKIDQDQLIWLHVHETWLPE